MVNRILGIIMLLCSIATTSCSSNQKTIDRLDLIYGNLLAKDINTANRVNFEDPFHILIDVRTEEEYNEGHIPYAINLDIQADDFANRLLLLDPKKMYFVYGKDKNQALLAREALKVAKITKVFGFENGIGDYSGTLVKTTWEFDDESSDGIEIK
ncbi:rhodanese-like domain-containing protein [Vaginella massiliensis]|uniref:rhodanese-like domain-containing protein n=1 Tax=Vaginella massiliensis TaxID=1816680 RepID=UPI000838994D|nr:rhodanese-like domain-containing protein [Vaginella massiliensis]